MQGVAQRLVEVGLLTREQLSQAVQAQVVYGGRLGTNLVELGFLTLDDLEPHLAEYRGVPVPPKEWLERPSPDALAAISTPLAERLQALPLRVESERMHVVMVDPDDDRALEELREASGRSVVPYILPELRLVYQLERHLGIKRDPRFANYARRLERSRSVVRAAASSPDPATEREEQGQQREALGIRPLGQDEELIDESAFSEMHSRLDSARMEAQGGPPDGHTTAEGEEAAQELLLEDILPDGEPGHSSLVAPATSLSPADIVALENELGHAPDRDAAARTAVVLARAYARAAALFLVHRRMVIGLQASGGDLESRIGGILVPIEAESVFSRVATSGESFRGVAARAGLDERLLRAMGRADSDELALIPVSIGERVVNVLYVDNGPDPLGETSLGALRALAHCIARSYRRIIVTRRRERGVAS